MSYSYFPLSTAPAPYDTVWSRFPYVENKTEPGPKPHPALVRQAFADQDGKPWVTVVYGTSKDPYRTDLASFSIVTIAEMNMCGLKQATRFNLQRVMTLPWAREFFECLADKPTPIIGHMPDYEVRKLQTQIAYLQQMIAEMEDRNDDGSYADNPAD